MSKVKSIFSLYRKKNCDKCEYNINNKQFNVFESIKCLLINLNNLLEFFIYVIMF